MDSYSWGVIQLIFVTVVYCFAYRLGYRAAKARTASTVKQVSGGVTELLDSLNDTLDQALEAQKKKQNERQ